MSDLSKWLEVILSQPLFLLIPLALIILCIKVIRNLSGKKKSLLPFRSYQLEPSILTATELKFYKVLVKSVPAHYTLLIKPRIADYVKTEPFNLAAFNRINSKHIDFLICNAQSLEPILGIELDDSSHQKKRAQERDAFVETLYRQISLPLYRVKTAKSYDKATIQNEIIKRST